MIAVIIVSLVTISVANNTAHGMVSFCYPTILLLLSVSVNPVRNISLARTGSPKRLQKSTLHRGYMSGVLTKAS